MLYNSCAIEVFVSTFFLDTMGVNHGTLRQSFDPDVMSTSNGSHLTNNFVNFISAAGPFTEAN